MPLKIIISIIIILYNINNKKKTRITIHFFFNTGFQYNKYNKVTFEKKNNFLI